MTTPLQMPGSGSDPTNQTLSFYLRDGTTRVDVSMGDVDMFNKYNIAGNINLSCQIGACILMLVVFVLVTPWAKLCKPANILHILNLATSTVRLILLVVDSISSRGSFYYIWTLDASVVNPADIRSVIAGITLGIVQILFIESALMLQALSLVQLWPRRIKWPFVILSGLVALSSVIFKAVSTIYINIMIANGYTDEHYYLPYRWNTILNAASIFYFTAIFNCRLVHHMWTHRSFLPSSKGLTAMEVLVATNGILMILPCAFHIHSSCSALRVRC